MSAPAKIEICTDGVFGIQRVSLNVDSVDAVFINSLKVWPPKSWCPSCTHHTARADGNCWRCGNPCEEPPQRQIITAVLTKHLSLWRNEHGIAKITLQERADKCFDELNGLLEIQVDEDWRELDGLRIDEHGNITTMPNVSLHGSESEFVREVHPGRTVLHISKLTSRGTDAAHELIRRLQEREAK